MSKLRDKYSDTINALYDSENRNFMKQDEVIARSTKLADSVYNSLCNALSYNYSFKEIMVVRKGIRSDKSTRGLASKVNRKELRKTQTNSELSFLRDLAGEVIDPNSRKNLKELEERIKNLDGQRVRNDPELMNLIKVTVDSIVIRGALTLNHEKIQEHERAVAGEETANIFNNDAVEKNIEQKIEKTDALVEQAQEQLAQMQTDLETLKANSNVTVIELETMQADQPNFEVIERKAKTLEMCCDTQKENNQQIKANLESTPMERSELQAFNKLSNRFESTANDVNQAATNLNNLVKALSADLNQDNSNTPRPAPTA